MKDIVIVPSFYRPEFLAMCLEYLATAHGGPGKEVWVCQDRHTQDEFHMTQQIPGVREVCRRYQDAFGGFQLIERRPNNFRGNPSNFLEAYRTAYERQDVRYVYLVEDDVMVAPDFFLWHEAVQVKLQPFISVAWHCIRETAKVPATDDPHAYVASYRDFSSIGICWARENLAPLVAHATADYYLDPGGYLRRAFPQNRYPRDQHIEQAGLISRLLHDKPGERLVVWSGPARVSHVGVQGYHRKDGPRFPGKLDDRIQSLRECLLSEDSMRALNKSQWGDINVAQDLGPWSPEKLYCMQTNEYNGVV